MSGRGSVRKPDLWVTLARMPAERASGLGVQVNHGSDSVTLALPGGRVIVIFGNGEIWDEGRCEYIHLDDMNLNWR